MADSLWARLERFDEISLPSIEAAARDDDDDAEFGQRHADATFKVSKRIMCRSRRTSSASRSRWRRRCGGADQRGTPPPPVAGGASASLTRLGGARRAARAVRRLRRGRLRAGGAPVRRRPPAVVRRGGPAGGARPRAVAAGGHTGSALGRHAMVVYGGRGEDEAAPGASRAADALDEAGGRRAAARHAVLEPAARRRRRPAAERARAPRVRRDGSSSLLLFSGEVSPRASWRSSSRDPRDLHTPPIPACTGDHARVGARRARRDHGADGRPLAHRRRRRDRARRHRLLARVGHAPRPRAAPSRPTCSSRSASTR